MNRNIVHLLTLYTVLFNNFCTRKSTFTIYNVLFIYDNISCVYASKYLLNHNSITFTPFILIWTTVYIVSYINYTTYKQKLKMKN